MIGGWVAKDNNRKPSKKQNHKVKKNEVNKKRNIRQKQNKKKIIKNKKHTFINCRTERTKRFKGNEIKLVKNEI